MTTASAWLDADVATEDEKLDLADFEAWSDSQPLFGADISSAPVRRSRSLIQPKISPHAGEIYVTTGFIHAEAEDGDYRAVYRAALEALFEADPRVAAGHAYRIEII